MRLLPFVPCIRLWLSWAGRKVCATSSTRRTIRSLKDSESFATLMSESFTLNDTFMNDPAQPAVPPLDLLVGSEWLAAVTLVLSRSRVQVHARRLTIRTDGFVAFLIVRRQILAPHLKIGHDCPPPTIPPNLSFTSYQAIYAE